MRSVAFLALVAVSVAAVPVASQAFPGVSVGAATSGSDIPLADLPGAIDNMARKFTFGAEKLSIAKLELADALGKTEQVQQLKAELADLRAQPFSPEVADQILAKEALVTEAIASASKEKGELDDLAKERIRAADMKRFEASLYILALIPDLVPLSTSIASLTTSMASGNVDPTVFKPIKASFTALDKQVKAFTQENKAVNKTMKAIYKTRKIEPADYDSAKPITEESEF